MVFSSLIFLYFFLPATLVIYYLTPRRLRNPVLLIASLIFYGWGEPVWVSIMVFSSILDFTCSNVIERHRDDHRICRTALLVSIVLNLGILCFFKYTDFLMETVGADFRLGLELPIGISFYTFQTMSCTIDVYRGEAKAQRNLLDFATYVTLFPQLIAGPIVRYKDIAEQLSGRRERAEQFASGVVTFCVGLGKKVLLANSFGALWDTVKARGQVPASAAIFGLVCFALQIYFDFSGYSDMAVGLGRMFGFELPVNFNYPYISRSITEFWRRWHITLGTWFREYVYIPLGGNRVSAWKQFSNIFVVWFLTGLWHGASWNFVIWGLYYGVILFLEKLVIRRWKERNAEGSVMDDGRHVSISAGTQTVPGEAAYASGTTIRGNLRRLLQHIYALFIVLMGWAIFELTDLSQLLDFFRSLAGTYGLADRWTSYELVTCLPLLLAGILGCTPIPRELGRKLQTRMPWITPLFCGILLIVCTAYLVNASYNPFLYFRF